jgi:hypothetical protein
MGSANSIENFNSNICNLNILYRSRDNIIERINSYEPDDMNLLTDLVCKANIDGVILYTIGNLNVTYQEMEYQRKSYLYYLYWDQLDESLMKGIPPVNLDETYYTNY